MISLLTSRFSFKKYPPEEFSLLVCCSNIHLPIVLFCLFVNCSTLGRCQLVSSCILMVALLAATVDAGSATCSHSGGWILGAHWRCLWLLASGQIFALAQKVAAAPKGIPSLALVDPACVLGVDGLLRTVPGLYHARWPTRYHVALCRVGVGGSTWGS